jgi:uncharacterized protein YciI
MIRTAFIVLSIFWAGASWAESWFLLDYRPAVNFVSGVALEKQPGAVEHAAFVRELHERGLLIMGGTVGDRRKVLILKSPSIRDPLEVSTQDPWAISGVMTIEVAPWQLDQSSVRVITKRKPLTRPDEDATFRIEGTNKDTPIRIDER